MWNSIQLLFTCLKIIYFQTVNILFWFSPLTFPPFHSNFPLEFPTSFELIWFQACPVQAVPGWGVQALLQEQGVAGTLPERDLLVNDCPMADKGWPEWELKEEKIKEATNRSFFRLQYVELLLLLLISYSIRKLIS